MRGAVMPRSPSAGRIRRDLVDRGNVLPCGHKFGVRRQRKQAHQEDRPASHLSVDHTRQLFWAILPSSTIPAVFLIQLSGASGSTPLVHHLAAKTQPPDGSRRHDQSALYADAATCRPAQSSEKDRNPVWRMPSYRLRLNAQFRGRGRSAQNRQGFSCQFPHRRRDAMEYEKRSMIAVEFVDGLHVPVRGLLARSRVVTRLGCRPR